jgi:hypothetical protein
MSIQIELKPEIEAELKTRAQKEGLPVSQYVERILEQHVPGQPVEPAMTPADIAVPSENSHSAAKIPKPMIVFYTCGLLCSIGFAILLALSAAGIRVLHPFLSLIGMLGGLGWVTTALRDILSLRSPQHQTKEHGPKGQPLEKASAR